MVGTPGIFPFFPKAMRVVGSSPFRVKCLPRSSSSSFPFMQNAGRERENFLSLGRERCPFCDALFDPPFWPLPRRRPWSLPRREVDDRWPMSAACFLSSSFLEESESFFSSVSFRLVALNELPDHKRDGDGFFLLILGLLGS